MITFSMVDVQSVDSEVSRSTFSEADLDRLADLILESGGLLKPLVLKKTGFEKYVVIDGHFEYYAAVRLKEKNPRAGEMVNALIIPPDIDAKAALRQSEALTLVSSPKTPLNPANDTTNLESRIANIELRLEKQINDLRAEQAQEKQRLDDKLKEISSRIPEPMDALHLINTLSRNDLTVKLQQSRISKAEKLAESIDKARRKQENQMFKSYTNVVKSVAGLGEKTMLTIIDAWSNK